MRSGHQVTLASSLSSLSSLRVETRQQHRLTARRQGERSQQRDETERRKQLTDSRKNPIRRATPATANDRSAFPIPCRRLFGWINTVSPSFAERANLLLFPGLAGLLGLLSDDLCGLCDLSDLY
jgi:hypothetical protein